MDARGSLRELSHGSGRHGDAVGQVGPTRNHHLQQQWVRILFFERFTTRWYWFDLSFHPRSIRISALQQYYPDWKAENKTENDAGFAFVSRLPRLENKLRWVNLIQYYSSNCVHQGGTRQKSASDYLFENFTITQLMELGHQYDDFIKTCLVMRDPENDTVPKCKDVSTILASNQRPFGNCYSMFYRAKIEDKEKYQIDPQRHNNNSEAYVIKSTTNDHRSCRVPIMTFDSNLVDRHPIWSSTWRSTSKWMNTRTKRQKWGAASWSTIHTWYRTSKKTASSSCPANTMKSSWARYDTSDSLDWSNIACISSFLCAYVHRNLPNFFPHRSRPCAKSTLNCSVAKVVPCRKRTVSPRAPKKSSVASVTVGPKTSPIATRNTTRQRTQTTQRQPTSVPIGTRTINGTVGSVAWLEQTRNVSITLIARMTVCTYHDISGLIIQGLTEVSYHDMVQGREILHGVRSGETISFWSGCGKLSCMYHHWAGPNNL